MGRRFQAYYVYNEEDCNSKKIAFHMQVCCGDDTICLLEQVLLFTEKYLKYPSNYFMRPEYDFNKRSEDLLESITGVIHRTGVFLGARKLEYDIIFDDPKKADNNEGIFVIDLRNDKPKYCLMNYNFKIVTPEEYFDLYRDEYTDKDEILKDIPEIISNIKKFNEITLEEIKELFPQMYV